MAADNRRLLVATVASIAVVVFWQMLFPPPKETPAKGASAPAAQVAKATETPVKTDGSKAQPAPTTAAAAVDAPEEFVALEGNGFTATVSTHGGTLVAVALKGKKFVEDREGKTQAIDLVRSSKDLVRPLAIVATKESGGTGEPWTDPSGAAPMRIVAKSAKEVTLEGRAGNLSVRKTYRVTEKANELALDLELDAGAATGNATLLLAGQLPADVKTGGLTSAPSMDMFKLVCRGGEKTERLDVNGDDKGTKVPGAVSYAGLDQHYFLVAAIPAKPSGECAFVRGPKPKSGLVALTVPVEPGGAKKSFSIFVGPKDLDALRAYGRGLDTAIDYGPVTNLFAFFARGLLYVMRWLHNLTGNWGVAIILLTFLVKAVLFPLTYKSTLSMNAMRALQPEIEKLKEKHKGDREKLQQETMQLYQKNKVNPLGGCLPMLLQMPIWFALYAALQTSVELYREPFLWLRDLTIHDPIFILPVLLGASSFAMQKLSPQPADNAQAKMMLYFFPAFFTFIMIFVPSGLTLYIVVNNVLTIVQQRMIGTGTKAAGAKA